MEGRKESGKDVEYFIKLLNIFKAAVQQHNYLYATVYCRRSWTISYISINIIFFQGSNRGDMLKWVSRCRPLME